MPVRPVIGPITVAPLASTPVRRALIVAWLALAILGAQAVGCLHRLEHGGPGGWAHVVPHGASSSGSPQDALARVAEPALPADLLPVPGDDPTHACAAVDALALGAGPPSATAVAVAPAVAAAASFRQPAPAPDATRLHRYRARAPPSPA